MVMFLQVSRNKWQHILHLVIVNFYPQLIFAFLYSRKQVKFDAFLSYLLTRITWDRQWPCGFSWFCFHPVGPYLRDQEWMLDPYQDRPSQHLIFHHNIMHQVRHFIHPMMTHTFNNAGPHHPQGPHHHQELFERSPVGFLLKSTGN